MRFNISIVAGNFFQISEKFRFYTNEGLKKVINVVTRLEKFRREMEPAKELYTKELEDFTKKYDSIGNMTLKEEPDIDTLDYIFSFERLNGTAASDLDEILLEISNHMKEFSKANGITKFYQNAVIWL